MTPKVYVLLAAKVFSHVGVLLGFSTALRPIGGTLMVVSGLMIVGLVTSCVGEMRRWT